MKKLMILSAATLAICLVMPQFAEATTVQNVITVSQNKEVKYQEIPASTLPEAVTKSLINDYAGYAVDKVFQGDDGSFKVLVSKGTVKNALLYNNKGEFVAVEKPTPGK